MPIQALSHIDPRQFFRLPSTDGTETQRLNTQVGGVAVSNDLSGRLSVTTAEGDRITLTADLEYDFRAVKYSSQVADEGATVNLKATYVEATLKKEFGVTVDGDLSEQELHDLEKLFRKVSNIVRDFFRGKDEEGLAKTAKLAERLEQLPSIAGLDLNVDVQRSFTVLAAQIASAVTGRSAVPTGQEAPVSTTSLSDTPGGAPATEAVIPPPSTGATAPTSALSLTGPVEGAHVSAPAKNLPPPSSLAEQLLGALKDTKAESQVIRRYLHDFLEKLRENLAKELLGEREQHGNREPQPTNETPAQTNVGTVFAYGGLQQTSVALSIHG